MDCKKPILILFFIICILAIAVSQTNSASHKINIEVPEVALLALVSDNANNVNFESNSPVEAGAPINFSNIEQKNNIWINYSSISRDKNHFRKIVALLQGEVPQGIRLLVEASEASGAGNGHLGFSSGSVALSAQPTEIINNIGSCYTGKGANNGHLLKYKLEFDESSDSYSQLAQAGTSINVIYTLTDAN